jgi:Protein of unknown function (DUF3175)
MATTNPRGSDAAPNFSAIVGRPEKFVDARHKARHGALFLVRTSANVPSLEMVVMVRKATRSKKPTKGWSQEVTEHSNALDLQRGVFALNDPKKIAASLKRSAEASHRRKSDPYRSAMSMLTFYVNRAGKNLSDADRARLEKAKQELRKAFDKTSSSRGGAPGGQ